MRKFVPSRHAYPIVIVSLYASSTVCFAETAAVPPVAAPVTAPGPPPAPAWLIIAKDGPRDTDVRMPIAANGFVTHQARKLTLWWAKVPGATAYRVYRGLKANQEDAKPVATNIAATTYSDEGLKDGTAYFYKVTASNAAGESPRSVEASGETKSAPKVTVSAAAPYFGIGDGAIRTKAWLRADASSEDPSLTYVWKNAGRAVPKAILNAKSRIESRWTNIAEAEFSKPGVYDFTVTVTDSDGLSTDAPLQVKVEPIVTSVTVSPSTMDLYYLQRGKFTAKASDQFGDPITTPVKLVWLSGDGSVDVDSKTGTVTAPRFRPDAPYLTSISATEPGSKVTGAASITIRDHGPVLVKPASVVQCPPNDPPLTTQTNMTPEGMQFLAKTRAQTVVLSALARHDSGDGVLWYHWTILKGPEGANQNLGAEAPRAMYWLTKDGDYTFQVTITDQNRQSITSTVDAVVRDCMLVKPAKRVKPAADVKPRTAPRVLPKPSIDAVHKTATARPKARRPAHARKTTARGKATRRQGHR